MLLRQFVISAFVRKLLFTHRCSVRLLVFHGLATTTSHIKLPLNSQGKYAACLTNISKTWLQPASAAQWNNPNHFESRRRSTDCWLMEDKPIMTQYSGADLHMCVCWLILTLCRLLCGVCWYLTVTNLFHSQLAFTVQVHSLATDALDTVAAVQEVEFWTKSYSIFGSKLFFVPTALWALNRHPQSVIFQSQSKGRLIQNYVRGLNRDSVITWSLDSA